jgi:hypothetical protein
MIMVLVFVFVFVFVFMLMLVLYLRTESSLRLLFRSSTGTTGRKEETGD